MFAAMLTASAALAACGSDSSKDSTSSPAASTPAATPTTTTPPAATTATTDATGGEAVTQGDKVLALGTRVVAPYVVYGKTGATQMNTTVGVTVLRIRTGKISDFKDFNLDAKQKATNPYFVDVKYENLGKLKLQRFLLDPSIEDTDGQEYKPLNLIVLSGTFKKCPVPSHSRLAGGQSFTLCAPFLLPKGKTLERVRFQGDVTKDAYFWK
ncbi:MAG: hypothetical protein QOJ35_3470 [Solirubrobacteraceae bacterium]|jgi:hypothetical protein|nr:hypothetical protein [Solirubrobacteraceae bacterium]